MSITIPKRRVYDGDVASPRSMNDLTRPAKVAATKLNEQNLSSAWNGQVTADDDFNEAIAWRVKHAAVNYATELISGTQASAAGILRFADTEQWVEVWSHTWASAERATIYAQATVQAGHSIDRGSFTKGVGLAQFLYLDAQNIKLAWGLDGNIPSEHVCGALDTGSAAINMEAGISGEFNAVELSAAWPDSPPGSHTIRLYALRSQLPDDVNDPLRRVFISSYENLVWEISR